VPVQKTLPLEGAEVLHHGCLAGVSEMMLDFARAGSDAFFALLRLDELQNALLSVGEHVNNDPCEKAVRKFK
jgi:hypothetical protein